MVKKKIMQPSWLENLVKTFLESDMLTHIVIASVIRLVLVIYGVFHDKYSDVPYTDIDYKVFTDAARHITEGNSPYLRHTFRYSPLIAIFLTPNIFFHSIFGKIIFCEIDLIVAYFIRRLVYLNVLDWMTKYSKYTRIKPPLEELKVLKKKPNNKFVENNPDIEAAIFWAHRAMLFWLYNPMTMAISTRGNSDSLACLLVILTLYLVQTHQHPFKAGLMHGFSIHFRIYPIIYSLTLYTYYSRYSYYFEELEHCDTKSMKSNHKKNKKIRQKKKGENLTAEVNGKKRKAFYKKETLLYFCPNLNQLMLISGTLTSLLTLTGIFYYFYGYKFLYESFIYHFIRVDFKHNFSLYFYLQYLFAFAKVNLWYTGYLWQPILMNLPPLLLIMFFSIRYGLNKFSLNFAFLVETIVFVVYNKVITSQYFVWIMGILPLCLWQIKMSRKLVIGLVFIWFLAQATWLLPAFLLEFQGENTFLYIWIQGVSLFCAHIGILGRIIKHFILPMGEMKKIV